MRFGLCLPTAQAKVLLRAQTQNGLMMACGSFLKADDNEISQIYVKSISNELETKITNSSKRISDFAWSKDDSLFAFSSFNEYEDDWGNRNPWCRRGCQI